MFRFTQLAIAAAICTLTATSFGQTKLCIDPGHGGSDPGASGNGQLEKTNVLNTGLKFRNWLNADSSDGGGGGNWTVLMTRSSDTFPSLSDRTNYANSNGVARFMSIHNNACCGASGTETFCHTSLGTSADLRDKIQQRSIEAWGLANRGNKTATFYVLTYTNMPATLAELGFITHPTDAGFLGNSGHQDNMAKRHMYAIQNHLGITAYTPGTGTLPTYTNDSPTDSGSWAVGTSAGDKYGADYKFHSTSAVSDSATWSINVGVAGTYKIQAWWCAGANRSATAPYIPPGGGSFPMNQQGGGGAWQTVTTRALGTGVNNTQLSIWTTAGFIVVADAVRYTP